MAGKVNKVTIEHINNRTTTVVRGDTSSEQYKIIGNQVVGFEHNWTSNPEFTFLYTIQPGDVVFMGKSSEDEELCDLIYDLEKEDLDKIRNFMNASGMIK